MSASAGLPNLTQPRSLEVLQHSHGHVSCKQNRLINALSSKVNVGCNGVHQKQFYSLLFSYALEQRVSGMCCMWMQHCCQTIKMKVLLCMHDLGPVGLPWM